MTPNISFSLPRVRAHNTGGPPAWCEDGVHTRVLGGLTVDPSVYVAYSPSQMLAYPVGGQSPLSPFVADGPFGTASIASGGARRWRPGASARTPGPFRAELDAFAAALAKNIDTARHAPESRIG